MPGYIGRGNVYGALEVQELVPNGSQTEFDLLFKVGSSSSLLVLYGGVVQQPGPGKAYVTSQGGSKIAFNFIPQAGYPLYLLYLGRELSVPRIIGSEPILHQDEGDNLQDTFTMPLGPVNTAALIVFKDGVQQRPTDDFTVSGSDVIFTAPPGLGAKLDFYIHGVERTDIVAVLDNSITAPKIAPGAVTNSKIYLSWDSSWTPSIQAFGGMIISGLDILKHKFMDLGDVVKIDLHLRLTLSGTLTERIRFNLPFQNDGDTNIAGIVNLLTDTRAENGMVEWASLSELDIVREGRDEFTNEEWIIKLKLEYDKLGGS